MKRFIKAILLRKMAATPIGAVFLAVGWMLGRRRKKRAAQRHETPYPARRAHADHRPAHAERRARAHR